VTQQNFIDAIERNTAGLTHLSTGISPGCETCLDTYGLEVTCDCEHNPGCERCDGEGRRPPSLDEFREQWSTGRVAAEDGFTRHGCDLCGAGGGFNTQPWHAIDADGEQLHGDDACYYCQDYLANGNLPGDG